MRCLLDRNGLHRSQFSRIHLHAELAGFDELRVGVSQCPIRDAVGQIESDNQLAVGAGNFNCRLCQSRKGYQESENERPKKRV